MLLALIEPLTPSPSEPTPNGTALFLSKMENLVFFGSNQVLAGFLVLSRILVLALRLGFKSAHLTIQKGPESLHMLEMKGLNFFL